MYFVYILKSKKGDHFYTGLSMNIENRLKEHNAGYTKSTKPFRPWKIIHTELFRTKSEANKREWHLKHPVGYLEKKRIIEHYSSTGGFA